MATEPRAPWTTGSTALALAMATHAVKAAVGLQAQAGAQSSQSINHSPQSIHRPKMLAGHTHPHKRSYANAGHSVIGIQAACKRGHRRCVPWGQGAIGDLLYPQAAPKVLALAIIMWRLYPQRRTAATITHGTASRMTAGQHL